MKLIRELVEEIQYIEEATEKGEKKFYVSGPFIQQEVVNKNNRVYPSYIDESVRKYIKEKVERNNAWGELNHPQGPQIDLGRVSHRITELHKEGNTWFGKAIITDTPTGNIAKGLMSSGGTLGISTRGMGSLKPTSEGVMVVQPDYIIVTAGDIVSDPSAPGAFLHGIMENVDYFFDEKSGAWLPEESERIQKAVKKMSKSQIEETKLIMFENYINKLSKL
jgi:hypothetical protein